MKRVLFIAGLVFCAGNAFADVDVSALPDLGKPATATDGIVTYDSSATQGQRITEVKFDGDSSHYMDGQGNFTAPSSGGVVYQSDCSTITAGHCVDTDDGKLYYWNNAAVTEVASGGIDTVGEWLANTLYHANQVFFFKGLAGSVDATGRKLAADTGYFGRFLADYTTPAALDVAEIAKIYIVSDGGALFREPVADIAALQNIVAPDNGETRQVGDGSDGLQFRTFSSAATKGLVANDGTPGRWQETLEARVWYKAQPIHDNSPDFIPAVANGGNSNNVTTAGGKIIINSDGIYRIDYKDGLRTNSDGQSMLLVLNDGTLNGYEQALGFRPNSIDDMFKKDLPNTANGWANIEYTRTLYLKSGTQIDFQGTSGVELDGAGFGLCHVEKNIGVLDTSAPQDPALTDLEVLDSTSEKRGLTTSKQLWKYFSDKPSVYIDMATATGKTIPREKFVIVGVGTATSVWYNHTTSDSVFSPYSTDFTRIFNKTEEAFHFMAVNEIISAPFPSGRPDGTMGLTDDMTHVYVSRNGSYTSDFDNILYRDGMTVYVKSTGGSYRWNKPLTRFEKIIARESLRGSPVADVPALKALIARDYEIRLVTAEQSEYSFRLGKTPVVNEGDIADDAATGAWVRLTVTMATNSTATLQAITHPRNGQFCQVLNDLPVISFYIFNTNVESGLAANDGTPGFWNRLNTGNVVVDTVTPASATASESDGGTVPMNLFDGNTTTSGWANDGTVPVHFLADMGVGHEFVTYGFSLYRNSQQTGSWDSSDYSPKAFEFYGTNDGTDAVENRVILGTYHDQVIINNAVKTNYFIANVSQSFRYYGLNITENVGAGDNKLNITEMELFKANIIEGSTEIRGVEWDATVTYKMGDISTLGGNIYVSKQNNNTNHALTDAVWWQSAVSTAIRGKAWDENAMYNIGDVATAGGEMYISKLNTNSNHAVTDTTWWKAQKLPTEDVHADEIFTVHIRGSENQTITFAEKPAEIRVGLRGYGSRVVYQDISFTQLKAETHIYITVAGQNDIHSDKEKMQATYHVEYVSDTQVKFTLDDIGYNMDNTWHERFSHDSYFISKIIGIYKAQRVVLNSPGMDTTAIHNNVAAEIGAVPEKATPVVADVLLIEDSADGGNKKRVQIGNLPGGGGNVTKVGTPTNGQIGQWTGDGTLQGVSSLNVNFILADEAPTVTGQITYDAALDALRSYDGSAVDTYSPDNKIANTAIIDATGFNGNLATTDDTIQEVVQKVDDIVLGGTVVDTDPTAASPTGEYWSKASGDHFRVVNGEGFFQSPGNWTSVGWKVVARHFEKDGVPKFVWGIMNNTHGDDPTNFPLLKNIGFNTITTWDVQVDTTSDVDRHTGLATSVDVGLIVSLTDYARGFESDILPNWLSGQELTDAQAVLVANGARSFKKMTQCLYEATWLGSDANLQALTEAQKSQLVDEYYNKNEANLTSIINSSLATNNLIGFYVIDEPKRLVDQQLGTSISNLIHSLAPNASVMTTYPPGYLNNVSPSYILDSEWIAWGDAISSDAYVNPAESSVPVRASVDFVTNNVGLQEEKLKTTDKVNWVVLATDANTSEMQNMGATYTEALQFAQTYIAIMQGAKAVVYYQYNPFLHDPTTTTWFEHLAVHIAKLGNIAMQADIPQTITYDQPFSANENYIHGSFPDVIVKLMRNPEGQYVLLAANAETESTTVSINLNLFNNTAINRLFDVETLTTVGSTLTITLEPHGVRAYTFISPISLDNPVTLAVSRSGLTVYQIVTTHDSIRALHENADLIGQSFTVEAGQDGNLSEITLDAGQVVGGGATIECRFGQAADQLDMSTNYSSGTAHVHATGGFVVEISPVVPIAAGEVRAFVCQSSSGNAIFNYDTTNPFAGGTKFATSATDWNLTGHQDTAHDFTFGYTIKD